MTHTGHMTPAIPPFTGVEIEQFHLLPTASINH